MGGVIWKFGCFKIFEDFLSMGGGGCSISSRLLITKSTLVCDLRPSASLVEISLCKIDHEFVISDPELVNIDTDIVKKA